MQPPFRPPNPSDGSPAVPAAGGDGGDPPPAAAAGLSAQTGLSGERSVWHRGSTGGGEPDSPSWCRTQTGRFGVFQKRSLFPPRRPSSGYFSSDGDSQPTSPLSPRPGAADKATQTPSPAGQAVKHALQRMAQERGEGPGTRQRHGHLTNPSSMEEQDAQLALEFGRELQRFGDDYNRLLMQRRGAGRRQAAIPLNRMPHIHQEPVALLCVGLLLLLIGRIMYLQDSTNTRDHSQV